MHVSSKKFVLLIVWVLSTSAMAEVSLPDMRMEKRFGVGISAAGPLSLLGLEIDINLSEDVSIGGGIGTGMDYNTFMVKGRYLLLGKSVCPYFALGFARWWTDSTDTKRLSPGLLREEFLSPDTDLSKGFSVFLLYPALGVQFLSPLGFAVYAEAQYLFKLFSFANGIYAGLGFQWYM